MEYANKQSLIAAPHVAGLATYLIARERLTGLGTVQARITELATPGLVKHSNGSPNHIVFNGAT